MNRMRQCVALAAGAMIGAAGAAMGLGFDQPSDQPDRLPSTRPGQPNTDPTIPPGQPSDPGRNPGQPHDPSTSPGRQPDNPYSPGRQPGLDQPDVKPRPVPDTNRPNELTTGQPGAKLTRDQVDRIISTWPMEAKQAAQATLDKYGPPDGCTGQLLIWHNPGPWKKVMVSSMEHQHNFPISHKDCIIGFIDMRVPADKVGELAKFDGSLCVERTAGVIGAECDKEEMNFAALNLAHDIVSGSKSAEEARQELARVAMAFKQGTKDPITQDFKFPVERGNTGDPDQAVGSGLVPAEPERMNTPGTPDTKKPGGSR